MAKQQYSKLELTWIGKGDEPKLEPRILIEQPEFSYGDPKAENMLIYGDNLLALKALEQEYSSAVQCVFIDPPYNTGNAFKHYDDGIEHSLWLSLMKPRIEILRNLLKDEGSLWITLDENEVHYMKILCDEIFGRKNFVTTVVWNSRKSKQNDTMISLSHNHVLIYAKDIGQVKFNRMPIKAEKFENPDNDPRGPWTADPFDAPNIRPNLTYPIVNPNTGEEFLPPQGRCWRTTKEEYLRFVAEGRIVFGKTGKSKPQLKRYKSEALDKGETPGTWWDDCGTATEAKQEIIKLFGKDNLFDTPKPERLLERVIMLASDERDILLDSFLGSGTTAAVAHKMNRRWIGIELGEHAMTHCSPRLKAVIKGEQGGISESRGWKGGGGFKFYTLAPSLLNEDKYGNWIISKEYNAQMLAAAMAKQEGFRYEPDEQVYWKQGKSSEKDFIYTTTQFITVETLDKIHDEMQEGESLLIACKSYQDGCDSRHANISIKKIPHILMGRCEFGKDDYSFNIVNMPADDNEDIELDKDTESLKSDSKPKKGKNKKSADDSQQELF